MGITHFADAPRYQLAVGHLDAHWTLLGEHARCRIVGVRRIEVAAGGWSTPAHEHGREEEIFYVLAGRGLAWLDGDTAAIGAGDCIVCLPRRGPHTLHALEPLDVLAFGQRMHDESPRFPRMGFSLVGNRWVKSAPGVSEQLPVQFLEESKLGAPDSAPEPSGRPSTIVNVAEVDPVALERGHVARTRRNLGRAAGSRSTGLQHVEVPPGKESAPPHCHSLEEEIFVVLAGEGVLVLEGADGASETPIRDGSVISRPAGSAVSHLLRAGQTSLTYLAYGTRDPGDVCYYPRSNKIAFRGVGVIARLQKLDYWDGEG